MVIILNLDNLQCLSKHKKKDFV